MQQIVKIRTAALVVILLLLSSFVIFQPTSEGIFKTTFNDGTVEKIINFPSGGGSNNSINLSLPYGTSISQARLNITPIEVAGEYPSNIFLDVGRDNDYEWAFSGIGYGQMGHQRVFNDSSTSMSDIFYTGSGESLNNLIKIPKSAEIESANLTVTGKFFDHSISSTITSSLGLTYACELSDIDGDTDLDLFVTYRQTVSPWYYILSWLNNTAGDGSTWTKHDIVTSGINLPYGLAAGDLDGDNDTDVVISDNPWSSNKRIIWYNNTKGDGSTWTANTLDESLTGGTTQNIFDIFIADMNNDSHNDVVAVHLNTLTTQEDLFWFANSGNGTPWTKFNISKTTSSIRNLFVADIDGDGDNDTAVTTPISNDVIWFSNDDGNGTSWSSYVIDDSLPNAYSLSIGDIDKDLNPDVAVVARDNTVWYEAPDDPTNVSAWTRHYVGPGFSQTWGVGDIALGDIGYNVLDQQPDGNLDIFICSASDNDVILFKSDGTPTDGGWTTIMLNRDHSGAAYISVGDINGDSYDEAVATSLTWSTLDDAVWYRLYGGCPTNVELDIGIDATADWVKPGRLNNSIVIPNFKTNLTQYISQSQGYKDEYGNEFMSIPITFTTTTPGEIIVSDLNIKYNYTATVDLNPHGNLATEFSEMLEKLPPDQEGNSSVPLFFTSSTGGQLKIHDLLIEYNKFPWFIQDLPEVIYLPEDSANNILFDISTYVADDYLESNKLDFEISHISGPGKDKVTLGIYNYVYLSADALTGSENDNWTGYLEFVIEITDNFNSTIESVPVKLMVTPENDEPTKGPHTYPMLYLPEGGKSMPLDLDSHDYFIDIDNDPLYFSGTIPLYSFIPTILSSSSL